MNYSIPTDDILEHMRSAGELVAFLGPHHPLPYQASEGSHILVTDSRDHTMIGKVFPLIGINHDKGIVNAVANGYMVQGVVYDPEAHWWPGRAVAFPYEEGWLWGSIIGAAPNDDGKWAVKVHGGVGVAAPPAFPMRQRYGMSEHPAWTVYVDKVFPIHGTSSLPLLTDCLEVIGAKRDYRRVDYKRREMQYELFCALIIHGYEDSVESDELSVFKDYNVFYVDSRPTLMAPVGTDDGKDERFLTDRVKDALKETENPVHLRAVRFTPKTHTTKIESAKHPQDAVDTVIDRMIRRVKDDYGYEVAILDTGKPQAIYSGVGY